MPQPTLSPRAIRGLALIAASLVALAFVIVIHVRPAPSPAAVPAAAREPDLASTMDWISAREGWISALDRRTGTGTLFHTTDAGHHWSRLRVARGVETPEFFDSRHGFLISAAGTLRTSDGGRSWQALTLPAGAGGQRPAFADPAHGWVWDPSPAGLYATADGGTQWGRLPASGLPAAAAAARAPQLLGFRDARHGWLARGGALFGTGDGGRTWSPVPLPLPDSGPRELGPLGVAPDGRGQLLVSAEGSVWVAATVDGGATWTAARPLPPFASKLTPDPADGTVSWAWSATQLQVTRDAGGHWTPVALPAWNLVRLQALNSLTMWTAATVIDALGAPRWTLFSTLDSGLTWNPAITPALA